MKADEKKELLKERPPRDETGVCRFCRQMRVEQVPEGWGQEDIDEYTTEMCDCKEAVEYTKAKRRREKISKAIEQTFKPSSGMELPEEVVDLLKEGAKLIECGELEQMQVKANGVTGTICAGKDRGIKVKGSRTLQKGMEV